MVFLVHETYRSVLVTLYACLSSCHEAWLSATYQCSPFVRSEFSAI